MYTDNPPVPPRKCMIQTMFSRCKVPCLHLFLLTALLSTGQAHSEGFVPVDQAFSVSVVLLDQSSLAVSFKLAPGVALYRERLSAATQSLSGPPQQLRWVLPPGQLKHDQVLDKDLELYQANFSVPLKLASDAVDDMTLTITYQGCAEAGLCYPPQHKTFRVPAVGQRQSGVLQPNAPGLVR
jgi:thiol:disulfide interchange protein DsbD